MAESTGVREGREQKLRKIEVGLETLHATIRKRNSAIVLSGTLTATIPSETRLHEFFMRLFP